MRTLLASLLIAGCVHAQKDDPRIPQDVAAFALTPDTDPAKKSEVEIGDNSKDVLIPRIAMGFWADAKNPAGEVACALTLQDAAPTEGALYSKGNAIEWERAGRIARMYQKTQPDGSAAMEFEVEYAAKPATNAVTWTIDTTGLDFFFQPPLTDEIQVGQDLCGSKVGSVTANEVRDDKGRVICSRAPEIVGSYAVFHSTKANNQVGGKSYGSGKAGHILRPEAIDAKGMRTWCDLTIDAKAGIMTVTTPQAFLDGAVYPVIVDPTFGFTTKGGSAQTNGSPAWCWFTAPSTGGKITSVTSWASCSSGSVTQDGSVYSDLLTAPLNKLTVGTATVTISSATAAEYTNNVTAYVFTASAVLWLGQWGSSAIYTYYYDSGTSNQQQYKPGLTYNTWPDPVVTPSTLSRKVSTYATYTVPSANFFLFFP